MLCIMRRQIKPTLYLSIKKMTCKQSTAVVLVTSLLAACGGGGSSSSDKSGSASTNLSHKRIVNFQIASNSNSISQLYGDASMVVAVEGGVSATCTKRIIKQGRVIETQEWGFLVSTPISTPDEAKIACSKKAPAKVEKATYYFDETHKNEVRVFVTNISSYGSKFCEVDILDQFGRSVSEYYANLPSCDNRALPENMVDGEVWDYDIDGSLNYSVTSYEDGKYEGIEKYTVNTDATSIISEDEGHAYKVVYQDASSAILKTVTNSRIDGSDHHPEYEIKFEFSADGKRLMKSTESNGNKTFYLYE